MADDLGSQIGIQNEINKVLVAREAIMKRNASLLQGQAQLAKELCNALRCENLDGMEERLQGIRGAMEDAANAAQNSGSEFNNATGEIGRMVDGLDDATTSTKSLNAATSAFKGAAKIFKAAALSITGIFGAVFNAISAVVGIIHSFYSAVIEGAYEAAVESRKMAEAFEDVREQFGDLATGEGLAVVEAFHDVDKAASEFGVNLGSRFAAYTEGSVAKLKAMAAAMENLGGLGPLLEKQFTGRVAFAMDSLAKGAGISGEAFQSLANRSLNSGQTLEGVMEQASRSIASVAKGIGVSTKTLGKSFDAIAKDVSNFGHLTVQEMTNLAAVMTKTGISMTTVQGVASKFDQFDSAAESVAKLTQAFGLNLNAVDLLNASDEERLQMLKSSFLEQGKSIDQLSRQERQYLAQAAGIAESDLERVFGDQAGSIDETASAVERAQEAQISMAASMQEMEKSIKRIFRPLEQFTGALDAFLKGFDQAFKMSGLLAPVQEALESVKTLGMESGNSIAEALGFVIASLGGFDQVTDGMIEPYKSLKSFFTDIGDAIKEGMQLDEQGIATGFDSTKLVEVFKDYFNRALKAIQQSGIIGNITSGVGSIFGAAIQSIRDNPEAIESIKQGLQDAFSFAFEQLSTFLQSSAGQTLIKAAGAALLIYFGPSIVAMLTPLMALLGPSMKAFLESAGSISPAMVGKAALAIGAMAVLASGSLYLFGKALGTMGELSMQTVKVGAAVMLFALGSIAGIALAAGALGAAVTTPPVAFALAAGAVAIAAFGVFISEVLVPLATRMVSGLSKIRPGAAEKAAAVAYDLMSAAGSLAALGAVLAGTSVAGAGAGVVSFLTGGKISPEDGMKKLVNVGELAARHLPRLNRAISRANVDTGVISAFTEDTIQIGSNMSKIAGGIKTMSRNLDVAKEAIGSGDDGALAAATALITEYNLVSEELRKLGPDGDFDLVGLESIATAASENATSVQARVAAAAKAIVKSSNEIAKAVRAIGKSGTNASVALDEFVKETSTGATKITVDREKIQFAINLNVNLVADKLAEALSDKSIVSEEFVLTRAGGGVTPSTA